MRLFLYLARCPRAPLTLPRRTNPPGESSLPMAALGDIRRRRPARLESGLRRGSGHLYLYRCCRQTTGLPERGDNLSSARAVPALERKKTTLRGNAQQDEGLHVLWHARRFDGSSWPGAVG